jgi:potassium-transporting ATPase potassium-binding subunit
MDIYSALQYALFLAIVTALVGPLGAYLQRVFSREPTGLDRLCLPLERLIYRVTAVDPDEEMSSTQYTICFVLFGLVGTLLLYAVLRLQYFPSVLPRIPNHSLISRPGFQYSDQLLNHHYLAGLWR